MRPRPPNWLSAELQALCNIAGVYVDSYSKGPYPNESFYIRFEAADSTVHLLLVDGQDLDTWRAKINELLTRARANDVPS